MRTADDDSRPPEAPALDDLRRVAFGYSASEARSELARLGAEDSLAYSAWQSDYRAREQHLANLVSRREVTASVLESVRATVLVLAAQVERARLNAERVERASAAEIEHDLESLQSRHATRIQEAHRQLLVAAQRRLELERSLALAIGRMEAAAREVLEEPPAVAVPGASPRAVEGSEPAPEDDDALRHLWGLLTGDDRALMPSVLADAASGLARIPLDAFRVAVQTRAGAAVGDLAALVVRQPGHRVVGYELSLGRDGLRWIPAGDVLALRPGSVVVRSGYRVLGREALRDAAESAPLRVVDPRRPGSGRGEGRDGAGAEEPTAGGEVTLAETGAEPAEPAVPASEPVGQSGLAPDATAEVELAAGSAAEVDATAQTDPTGPSAEVAAPAPPPPLWVRADVATDSVDWMFPGVTAAARPDPQPLPADPGPWPPAATPAAAADGSATGDAWRAPWAPSPDERAASAAAPVSPARDTALPDPWTGRAGTGESGPGLVAPDVLAFLTGKVVGQDIQGADGEIVARRGETIDGALAERVERAGRLPELIVYMTFADA